MAHPPPLPRTAARLSICVDFPGYLQLLQGPQRAQGNSCLLQNQTMDEEELASTERPQLGSEMRYSADLGATSILLPGYSRGSQGAPQRLPRGAASSMSKQRMEQPGSVDGAAEAVLLCSSGELPHHPVLGTQESCGCGGGCGGGDGGGGEPPPQAAIPCAEGATESRTASRAAAAAASTSASAVAAAGAAAMPPSRLLMLDSAKDSQASLQVEWSFDSDPQRARAHARCTAASSSRCQVRYEECAGVYGGSGSHRGSCSSRSSGDPVDRKRGSNGNGGGGGGGRNITHNSAIPTTAATFSTGGGGSSGRNESSMNGVGSERHLRATHVPVTAAATAWSTVTSFTGRMLRTMRHSSTVAESSCRTVDKSATSSGTAGMSGNGAAVRQAYCGECAASDADVVLDPREPSCEPCGLKAPQRPWVGGGGRGSLTPTPSRCRVLLGRTTSAPSFVGAVRQGDAGGELGALVTGASSISSRSLASSHANLSTAVNSAAGPSASFPAGDAAFLGRLAGRRDHRPRLLREWVSSLPWLGCGHGHLRHVSRDSFGYDRSCGSEGRSATAPSFTALDCLEELSPGGGGGGGGGGVASGEMGGAYGGQRQEALTEPLPKCTENYRLRAALTCGAAHPNGASQWSPPSAPTAFTDPWAASSLLVSADSRGGTPELVAVAPSPPLAAASPSVKRNRPSRLGSIWPSSSRPTATCG